MAGDRHSEVGARREKPVTEEDFTSEERRSGWVVEENHAVEHLEVEPLVNGTRLVTTSS